MARVTVLIRCAGEAGPERSYHIDGARAERFAARVRAEGGTARVVPLRLGGDLKAMLRGCGVDPATIR